MIKIKPLVKYEIINIRRSNIVWIIGILYAFGLQQSISSMFKYGGHFLSLVDFVGSSWLPLNFIMIPIMLVAMDIGAGENDIFRTMNISSRKLFLSKLITMIIIDAVILIVNIIVAAVIGILCKVSIGYFIYEVFGYIANTVILLLVSTIIGLFVGQVLCKYIGEVVGFILVIIIFLILCNFYKVFNIIVPLFNIRTFSGSFDVISYDKSYLYHNVFWILATLVFLSACLLSEHKREEKSIFKKVYISAIAASLMLCIYLGVNLYSMKPTFYDARRSFEADNLSAANDSEPKTFFSKNNDSYYIDKYNMDLILSDKLENKCEMEVVLSKDNINSVEVGLYRNLNIFSVSVDGTKADFKRNDNSFQIDFPKTYKAGDKISIKVNYEGIIKTVSEQGKQMFFVRNNYLFLGDVFEWYPKLNDSTIKEYNVSINYKGKNKLYSNLDTKSSSGKYEFQGKDREIVLVSGNITERKYKNYLFIGNEEYINNDENCNSVIEVKNKLNSSKVDKILFVPAIPGETRMDKPYEKAYIKADY
ncbi:hypothetical protein HMPREF1982_01267 [Clostridiales bacterium oral taxon 876 str. F0540]|nr:hypothetical protein HMPREF1982_01267 [Clostridiales bacterium oral taxon 876 str. F0540]